MRHARWCIPVAAALLIGLAPAPWAQEKSEAQELLKKVEEKLTKTDTLEFSAKIEVSGAQGGKLEGTVVFEGKNKFHMDFKGEKENKEVVRLNLALDGENVTVTMTEGEQPTKVAKKKVDDKESARKDFIVCIVYSGCLIPPTVYAMTFPSESITLGDLVKTSDFKMGGKEKVDKREAQTVEMKLTAGPFGGGTAILWIDSATHLPLRRKITVKSKPSGETMEITETYHSYKLNGKSPESSGMIK